MSPFSQADEDRRACFGDERRWEDGPDGQTLLRKKAPCRGPSGTDQEFMATGKGSTVLASAEPLECGSCAGLKVGERRAAA